VGIVSPAPLGTVPTDVLANGAHRALFVGITARQTLGLDAQQADRNRRRFGRTTSTQPGGRTEEPAQPARTIVYSNLVCAGAMPGVPIVIGGIEGVASGASRTFDLTGASPVRRLDPCSTPKADLLIFRHGRATPVWEGSPISCATEKRIDPGAWTCAATAFAACAKGRWESLEKSKYVTRRQDRSGCRRSKKVARRPPTAGREAFPARCSPRVPARDQSGQTDDRCSSRTGTRAVYFKPAGHSRSNNGAHGRALRSAVRARGRILRTRIASPRTRR